MVKPRKSKPTIKPVREKAEEVLPAKPIELVETALSQGANSAEMTAMQRLDEIENKVFDASANLIIDALSYSEVDPNSEEPPVEWVVELGPKRAHQKWVIAKSAWLSSKEAPIALTIAQNVYRAISASKAHRAVPIRSLNVASIVVHAKAPYEIVDVE